MKVVFLKDLEGHSKRGETREVKPGYARNYLIPQGIAVLVSDPSGKQIVAKVEAEKIQAEKDVEELKGKILSFSDLELVFKEKVNDKGSLFNSVKKSDIEKEFQAKTKIKPTEITLEEPIKEIGESSVEILLDHGLNLFVKIKVEKGK